MELHPGEHEIYDGHPSWRSILSFYFKGLLAGLAVGAILWFAVGHGAGIGGLAAILVLAVVVGFLKRLATTYAISNQRLHIRRGIIGRNIQETRIDRVQNVSVKQGALQRILQIGTVDFDTAGTTDSDFAFRGVGQPEHVMQAVEQAQREAAGPSGTAPAVPPARQSTP